MQLTLPALSVPRRAGGLAVTRHVSVRGGLEASMAVEELSHVYTFVEFSRSGR